MRPTPTESAGNRRTSVGERVMQRPRPPSSVSVAVAVSVSVSVSVSWSHGDERRRREALASPPNPGHITPVIGDALGRPSEPVLTTRSKRPGWTGSKGSSSSIPPTLRGMVVRFGVPVAAWSASERDEAPASERNETNR